MLIGGGLAGACIGGIMAYALVKVPAGVFDPPPEALTVPWVYLVLLFVSALGLTTAVVAAHLQDLQVNPWSASCARASESPQEHSGSLQGQGLSSATFLVL